MKRPLFTATALLGLGLAIALVTLWVRSLRTRASIGDRDRISFTHVDPLYWIISDPGRLVFCRQKGRNWDGQELGGFDVLSLSFGGTRGGDGSILWNLAVPHWMLTTLAIAVPLARIEAWGRDQRRRRREANRRCAHCGYDLRATPGRCPECGHATPDAVGATLNMQ
jgi:hypothetical protein